MPFGRVKLREFSGTLRFHLSLWNSLVVALFVLITLIALREGVRYSLYQEAERQLLEDANEVRLTIEQFLPNREAVFRQLERQTMTHTHRGLFVRIYDPLGKIIWASTSAPYPIIPVDPLAASDKPPASFGNYRLLHFRLTLPVSSPWIVRVGVSFAPLEQDVSTLSRLILIVGAISLILTPLGAYFLAGRATQPIAQIIDTATRLHPQTLNERLTVRGTFDELDRLSITINGLLDRIAAYIVQMRDFTANAAHELRSPLTAIQSSLEVGLNSDRSVDYYKELLATVLDECGQLRNLVNQLLLLAESEAGLLRFARHPVALQQMLEKSRQMFAATAEVSDVSLVMDQCEPAVVLGDASRLRQVLNNLIDNALKFTPAGGRVNLSLRVDPVGRSAILTVSDTGQGIAAVDLPNIFERFYRADRSRGRVSNSRSTGLGLCICRAIVQSHDGQITVESQPGQGSTFRVILPLAGSTLSSQAHDIHYTPDQGPQVPVPT